MKKDISILIPAYDPGRALPATIEELIKLGFGSIIVVNDGSGTDCDPIFDALARHKECHVISHEINRGKGRALKLS